MLDEDIQPIQAMLRQNEGCETGMYLDSDNPSNITIGVGHLIPSVSAAQEIPFLLVASGAPANPTEITNGYYALKSMPPRSDGKLRRYLGLYLESADIDSLLMADMRICDTYLHATFDQYDSFPQNCRIALMDMSYNLGSLQDFPLFKQAVLQQDWAQAAAQCHRRGVSAARNQATQNLFLSAVNQVV